MGIPGGRKVLVPIMNQLALITAVATVGCATSQEIELVYQAAPTEGMVHPSDVTIYLAPFEDYRTEPETVGVISHGLFESAVRPDIKIRLQRGTAALWVRDALAQELELRGYRVLDAANGADWQVHGLVLEMAYREGGWPILTRPSAVLTIECEIVHDGRTVLRDQYWNSTRASSRPGDPPRLLETVLRRNLRKFMEDLEVERKRLAEKG